MAATIKATVCALCLLLSGAGDTLADTFRVQLEDGREVTARAISVGSGVVVLKLDGSSRLTVSRAMISNWSELVEAVRDARAVRSDRWRLAAGDYAPLVERSARTHELSPALLSALAEVESGFNPRAVSNKGAVGLVQLMPETAKRFGVRDRYDPGANLDGGASYLRWLLDRYDGGLEWALAAYNAGEGAVDRYGGVPPYAETREFVRRVLARFGEHRGF